MWIKWSAGAIGRFMLAKIARRQSYATARTYYVAYFVLTRVLVTGRWGCFRLTEKLLFLFFRMSGGKLDIECAAGQTLDIDYVNRRWICKTGNYCPPSMGGVVFGCPALPPPVPENSTGE